MAMGHFPPHIKPFVFHWPGGRELSYLWACDVVKSQATKKALLDFLKGLSEAGVKEVHFLVHSIGVQVLVEAFKAELGERSPVSMLFQDITSRTYTSSASSFTPSSSPPSTLLLTMTTCTFLHPDTRLSDFLHWGFVNVRQVCNHITVIGDRKDQALYWSQIGNGLVASLRAWRKGKRLEDKYSRLPVRKGWRAWLKTPYQHGVDRMWSRIMCVGMNVFSLYDLEPQNSRRLWLDLDAIDCTWMETNVHALRHNYFTLNPVLVEDLHELIVSRKRAADRSLLLHREGNIYSYCQAPPCVVSS